MIARRALVAAAAAVALVLAVAAAGGAADRPGAARIVVVQEGLLPSGESLLDTAGHVVGQLATPVGMNGGIAVSPSGTQLAEVMTLTALPRIPGHRFPVPPESVFVLAPVMDSVVGSSSGGITLFGSSRSIGGLGNPRGRPSWAPGGLKVVCAFAARGGTQLRVVSLRLRDGRAEAVRVRALTDGRGSDLDPAWSPDGRWIVYEHTSGSSAVLMAVRPNGSDAHVLVGWAGRARYPSFDPTGRSLVFASDVSGRFQLYVTSMDGESVRRLTFDAGDDTHASWSPDGRWIAYSGTSDGDDEVYLVGSHGGSPRQLTHNATEDLVSGWQPVEAVRAPVVHIVSVSATRTRALARYTVSSTAPVVLVEGSLEASSGHATVGSGALPAHVDPSSLGVKTLRFPFVSEVFSEVPGATRVRVCVDAVDAWGHAGAASCRSAAVAGG